jgi:hypothetical protein
MSRNLNRYLLATLLIGAAACGGSSGGGKPDASGQAGTGGAAGTGGTSGMAGTGGAAGADAGAGTTGAAGADAAAGSTGAAGADAAAGTPGTDGGDAPASTDGGTTTANIKATTGGTVTAGGLTIEIPAGALAADTNITVTISDGSTSPSPSTVVSSVYDIGPNGTTFTKPVKLTIAYDTAKLGTKKPVVSYVSGGKWIALSDSSVASGKVTATTTHFTPFGVVGQEAAMCLAMAKADCQTCCKATYYQGMQAPLGYAIQECGCKTGSPCETQCKTNVCASMAPTTECQTCLNTQGSAQQQPACITASQTDCANDADCKAYAACNLSCGTAGTSDAGADTSSSDAVVSSEAGSDAGGTCTDLVDNAPVFMNVNVAAAFPAAAGGTITPGTYRLTEVRTYTGVGGATGSTAGVYSQTISFTSNTWTTVSTVNGQRLEVVASYTTDATMFNPTRTCPATGNTLAQTGYTATATDFTFFQLGQGANTTRFYVKQ